jgi:hypothetical protein
MSEAEKASGISRTKEGEMETPKDTCIHKERQYQAQGEAEREHVCAALFVMSFVSFQAQFLCVHVRTGGPLRRRNLGNEWYYKEKKEGRNYKSPKGTCAQKHTKSGRREKEERECVCSLPSVFFLKGSLSVNVMFLCACAYGALS